MPDRCVGARSLREILALPADEAGPLLLGALLERTTEDGERLVGRIVEVEAYRGPEDRASHARGGLRSARNESMYGRAGTAYVYFTYGMHHCMNVVCNEAGVPHAVLVRAIEPLEGLESMRAARARVSGRGSVPDREIGSGPAKLTQALGIDLGFDGADLLDGVCGLRLRPGERVTPSEIGVSGRIGLGACGEWKGMPWRWYVLGSPSVGSGRGAGAGGGDGSAGAREPK